jgi:hypothetical protein
MKTKKQKEKLVELSSIAVKLAAKRLASIEKAYMKELNNPLDDCPACQCETAINIYLNLAVARSQIIHDNVLELDDDETISLMDERDSYIIFAFDALMRKDNIDE